MTPSSYIDDPEWPFDQWCDEYDVFPISSCSECDGQDPAVGEDPCSCVVDAALSVDPDKASDSYPQANCERCGGDGDDFDGLLCPCILVSYRARWE